MGSQHRGPNINSTTAQASTLSSAELKLTLTRLVADIKDTQHLPPAYDSHSGFPPSAAGGFRSRSPALHFRSFSEDTTLSTFISKSFNQAKKVIQSNPKLSGMLPSSSGAEAGGYAVPSASTIGFVLLCGLWYLSSAFSSNTGKQIMIQFKYPVTLTFIQFAFVSGYSVLCLAAREQLNLNSASGHHLHHARRGSLSTTAGWGIRRPTRAHFQGTFMMSLFQIAGHVFSSMAIARVPVSTVHTIKALSPLFTVASYALLFKVRYSAATYTALLPLTLGVMLACSFDLRANAVGFLCALGSTVIFVSQNIFSKKLLPKDASAGESASATGGANSAKLDKLNLLFYSSGMAFVLMIPIWLWSDAGTLFRAWLNPEPVSAAAAATNVSSLTFYFFANGSVHFGQNLLAFAILARTSPVTYSIASLIKRIAVICLAIIWFHQKVSFIQGFGMTMTFFGLWLYNRAKSDVDKGERKRGQVEKRAEMFLPTSLEDVRLETPPPPGPAIFSPTYSPSTQYAQSKGVEEIPLARNRRSVGGGGGHHVPPPPQQHGSPNAGAVQSSYRMI